MATSVFTGLPPVQLHYLKAAYLASLEQLDQKEAELKTQLATLADMRTKVNGLMRELDQSIDRSARPEAADVAVVAAVAPHEAKTTVRRDRRRPTPKSSPG